MFYFIGLGLSDEKDITVKGLEIVQRAERVYLEAYTAILMVDQAKLFQLTPPRLAAAQESFYGRPVIVADREMVESSSDEILADADTKDIAFLVVGDAFGATTHTDLSLRARALSIPTTTIHNASILTGVSTTGLSLYNFGQTTSMVFFTSSWRPSSFYDRLAENASLGLHSLVLLDIKVKEPDFDALARGQTRYEPPRYMSASLCAAQMLETEEDRKGGICGPAALAVAVGRVGSADQRVVAGTLAELARQDLGSPLHSLVLVGKRTYELEREFLEEYAVDGATFREAWEKGGYGTA